VTIPERATQIWPLLALAARNRQILTYEIVARCIGVPRPAVGGILDPIQKYCVREGLPPLTALVVSEDSGLPGHGFTAAADVPRAQAAVFAFDWLKRAAPSPEDFEAAGARTDAVVS